MTRKPTRRLSVGLTAAIFISLGLAFVEIVLHWISPQQSFRSWYAASYTYGLDPDVDWKLEPRAYSWGQVNRFNFRGEEIRPHKEPGTFRIVVVGGSAAFDLFKRDGSTWCDQLQGFLRRELGSRIEVLNAGTPGYSTHQVYHLLASKLLRWHPDLVLFYELSNDSVAFPLSNRDDVIKGWKMNARANHITWAAHPNRFLDAAARLLPYTVDLTRISLVQFFLRKRTLESRRFWQKAQSAHRVHPFGLGFYEQNLRGMARLLRESGDIPLGIITQATLIREQNTEEERRRIYYFLRGLSPSELWGAHQAAWEINRKISRQEPNAFLIEAQNKVPHSLSFFNDEVHLNDAGGRLLAQVIAKALLHRRALLRLR